MEHAVTLECSPEFSPERLRIGYSVSNRGAGAVFVLDVLAGYEPGTRTPAPNLDWAYVCGRDGGVAYMLRGIPPLPAGRQVMVRIVPLATRLLPGERIERAFDLALPLRESSPYYLPLKDEEYDAVEVDRVVFAVQFVSAAAEGFRSRPAPHGAGFYRVSAKDIFGQAESVQQEFAAQGIRLWKRRDWFRRI